MISTCWNVAIAGVVVGLTTVVGSPAARAQESCDPLSYSISPGGSSPTSSYPATGQTIDVTVTAPAGCAWTAVSQAPFLTVLSGSAGSGNGTVLIDLPANPGAGRAGSLTIAGFRFLVAQAGCISIPADPGTSAAAPGYWRTQVVHGEGGRRQIRVTAASSVCSWPVAGHAPWIAVTGGDAGAGTHIVTYDVQPNLSGVDRSGTLTIGYETLTITQSDKRTADLDGDTHPDLLWQNRVTGQISTWLMNGSRLKDGRLLDPSAVPDLAWRIVGTGDFDADGHSDIVWQHDTGTLAIWYMQGTTLRSGQSHFSQMDSGWSARAVTDLNSDGRPDIIWQHPATGRLAAMVMFQSTVLDERERALSFAVVTDADWQVVGAGDFNQDGQNDLLWQHQGNGSLAVWFLRWSSTEAWRWEILRGVSLNPGQVSDTNWKVRGVMDVNGDGHPDLLWQHQSTGQISTWLMNGINVREGTLFSPGQVPDTNWVIVGPR